MAKVKRKSKPMPKLPPHWNNEYISLVRFLSRRHKSEDKREIKKARKALDKLQVDAWAARRGDIWIPEPDKTSGFYPSLDNIHYPTLRTAMRGRANPKTRDRAWKKVKESAVPFQAAGRKRGSITRAQENRFLEQAMVAFPAHKDRSPKYLGKKVPGQMSPASGSRSVLSMKEISPRDIKSGFGIKRFAHKDDTSDRKWKSRPMWQRVAGAGLGVTAAVGGYKAGKHLNLRKRQKSAVTAMNKVKRPVPIYGQTNKYPVKTFSASKQGRKMLSVIFDKMYKTGKMHKLSLPGTKKALSSKGHVIRKVATEPLEAAMARLKIQPDAFSIARPRAIDARQHLIRKQHWTQEPKGYASTKKRAKWGRKILKTAGLMATIPVGGYVAGRIEGGKGKKLTEKQLRSRGVYFGPTHNVGYITGRTPKHKRRGMLKDILTGPRRLVAKGAEAIQRHELEETRLDYAPFRRWLGARRSSRKLTPVFSRAWFRDFLGNPGLTTKQAKDLARKHIPKKIDVDLIGGTDPLAGRGPYYMPKWIAKKLGLKRGKIAITKHPGVIRHEAMHAKVDNLSGGTFIPAVTASNFIKHPIAAIAGVRAGMRTKKTDRKTSLKRAGKLTTALHAPHLMSETIANIASIGQKGAKKLIPLSLGGYVGEAVLGGTLNLGGGYLIGRGINKLRGKKEQKYSLENDPNYRQGVQCYQQYAMPKYTKDGKVMPHKFVGGTRKRQLESCKCKEDYKMRGAPAWWKRMKSRGAIPVRPAVRGNSLNEVFHSSLAREKRKMVSAQLKSSRLKGTSARRISRSSLAKDLSEARQVPSNVSRFNLQQYGLGEWWDKKKAQLKHRIRKIRKGLVGPARAVRRGAILGGLGSVATSTNFMPPTDVAGFTVRRKEFDSKLGGLSSIAIGQKINTVENKLDELNKIIVDTGSLVGADIRPENNQKIAQAKQLHKILSKTLGNLKQEEFLRA